MGFIMVEKLKVLTFVNHYLPGYKSGGALRTVANMVEHLKDDFDFLIITSDRDLGDEHPYSSVMLDRWVDVQGAKVFYFSREKYSIKAIKRLMEETSYDLLYLNSFL